MMENAHNKIKGSQFAWRETHETKIKIYNIRYAKSVKQNQGIAWARLMYSDHGKMLQHNGHSQNSLRGKAWDKIKDLQKSWGTMQKSQFRIHTGAAGDAPAGQLAAPDT